MLLILSRAVPKVYNILNLTKCLQLMISNGIVKIFGKIDNCLSIILFLLMWLAVILIILC